MPRRSSSAHPVVLLVRLLLGVGGGLGLALAFPPHPLPWVAPVAVALLFVAVSGARPLAALMTGLLFGLAFVGLHAVWMRQVSDGAWIGLAVALALFHALTGLVAAQLWRLPAAPLWLAAGWTALEGLRSSWPFGGMPWGQLAFAVVDTPVMRSLPYVGAVGVTYLLALSAGLLASLVVRPRRSAPIEGLVVVALLIAAPVVHPWKAESDRTWHVALVQPGFEGTDDGGAAAQQITDRLVAATTSLPASPDLVLWPEDATGSDPLAHPEVGARITAAAAAIGAPVLAASIVDRDAGHVANDGILWTGAGPGDRYVKRHPVPWGEYTPLRHLIGALHFGDFLPTRDMVAGPSPAPLSVAGARLADAICFDIAHADVVRDQVARGAELVTVQTSNVTFLHTAQLDQQFAISRIRAAESGRAVLVASVNGVSGVIRPDGSVETRLPQVAGGVIDASVPLVSQLTPADRAGPWPWRGAVVLTVVGLLAVLWRSRRSGLRRTVEP